MTWPSARRTSEGGWLSPEFRNSPSNSTPSASLGGSAMTGASPVDGADVVRWVLMDSVAALTVLHFSPGTRTRRPQDLMEGTCLEGTCLEGKGAARVRPGGPFPFRPLARPRSYAHSRPSVKVGKVLADNALKAKDVDVVVVGLDVDQAELVVVA